MKRSMTSRMLLSAALLIAGVGMAAAQGVQAGDNQRGEAKAKASVHRSGAQAQVQHKQSSGGAIHANRSAQGAKAHTATRSAARAEHPRAASASRQATRSAKSDRAKIADAKSSNKSAMHARADKATARERAKVAHAKSSNKAAMHARTDKATAKAQRTAAKAKPAADVKARTAAQTSTRERSTTGQAPRDANTETRAQARTGRTTITAEQQTRLRRVVTARNIPHVRRANFAVRTGIVVPRSVHFARVSAYPVLFDLYPDYRPYSFFVVQDEVVFVDSGRRIVDVVPLQGGGVASSGGGEAVAMDVDLSPEEIREIQTVLVSEGFPIEVTGVWDPRTRDTLITFQRRHGFAATGRIDTRTVAALRLNGKISQSHIRGASRATTGRGNGQVESNAKANVQPRQERSTSGQGGNEQPKAAQGRNEPKASNEAKASNEPKGGKDAKPRAERQPAQRSTTGQGSHEKKMNRSEPADQNK